MAVPRLVQEPPQRMKREDWPDRLAAMVEARRRVPFAWGEQDCMTWAADVILELSGVDFLSVYRGTYDTEDQAEAILHAEGGLEALLARLATGAGMTERASPRLAQRGDLALVRVGNQMMAGVITGTAIAVPGSDGLAFVPARLAQRAWGA